MDNKFSSKLGFILTAVGSAVGMANIWGFPYKLADGGLVFLLIYILFVTLFSYVGVSSELSVGRLSKTGALGSYEYSFNSTGKNKKISKYIGYLPLIGVFLLSIGYAVVVAYILKALIDSFTGTLLTTDANVWFEGFSTKPYSVVTYHIIVIMLTLLTCYGGARTLEKSNKLMIPAFFILFVWLAIRVLTLPNAIEGVKYMFRFDPSKFNMNTIITAMGQAFFSLSITGANMVMMGSYLKDDVDLVESAKETALYDTIAGLVASAVIIPALSVFNMEQVGGPGLLFVSLPTIMQNIRFGNIFSIILFTAVFFAGISSLQNMYEAVAESLISRFPKLKRNMVLATIGLIGALAGVNMETIQSFGPYMDIISIYILPVIATIGAITWFYILKKDLLLKELNKTSSKKYGDGWYKLGKFIYVPLTIILTILALVLQIAF